MNNKFLTDREFAGVVVTGQDEKNKGRYYVLIPELMYNIHDKDEGKILCMNHVSNYRNTYCDTNGSPEFATTGVYGQYFPLHPGTKVIVKFYEEDFQTAYIDRIISDYYEDSMPLKIETSERDQYYQLLRTIAYDLIAVTCDTTSIPSDGIHIYHKKDNVVVVFDKDGIHIYTKKDFDQRIDGKAFIKVDGDVDCVFSSNLNISVSGNVKIGVEGSCELNVAGLCNVDAKIINLNCGVSQAPDIEEDEKAPQIEFDQKMDIPDDFI